MRRWLLAIACLGCGAAIDPGDDAGPRPDARRPPPREPDPAALPIIAPCPDGWRETRGPEAVAECDPFPEGARPDCAYDEALFAGVPGCARIGTDCAADGWPSDLPTDRPIVYVQSGAAPGGDGSSRERPLGSIGAAMGVAPAGAVIAVAAGRYDEAMAVQAGQTLWGACASGTRITASTGADTTLLGLVGEGAGVRNLSIDTPERGAIAVAAAGTSIESVVIAGARTVAIGVGSGSVTLRDVVVRDTRASADGRFGNGLSVGPGAAATVERAVFVRSRHTALSASGAAARIDGRSVVVSDTLAEAERFGQAAAALAGATIVLSEAALEGNRAEAVFVSGSGSRVELSRSIVRGTLPQGTDEQFGRAADVLAGGALVLERTVASDNRAAAVYASGAGTSVELSDVVLRDTLEQASDRTLGFGAELRDGASASLSRVLLANNRTAGLFLASGATAAGADLTVVDTRSEAASDGFGRGVHAGGGARIELARVRLERNREAALVAVASGTEVVIDHLAVRDTDGAGASLEEGAQATLRVARIEGSSAFGLRASSTATAALSEIAVVGVADRGGGSGLVVQAATMSAVDFLLAGAAFCGALLGPGASLDLTGGAVDGAPVGACVQAEGFDFTRLSSEVEYRDVGATWRATMHPLPAPLPRL